MEPARSAGSTTDYGFYLLNPCYTMQASDASDSLQRTVLERLDKLTVDVDKLTVDVNGLKQELGQTNVRVDAYQKASTQVVNLAFGLIAIATLTIIATTVLK